MRYLILLLLTLTACGPGAHELVDTMPSCGDDGGPCSNEKVGRTSQALTGDPRTLYFGAQGAPYTPTSTDINMGPYNTELCTQSLLKGNVRWPGTAGVVYPESDGNWHLLTRNDTTYDSDDPDSIENFGACVPWSAFTTNRPLNVSFQWNTTYSGLPGDTLKLYAYALGDLEIPTTNSWSTVVGAQGELLSPRSDIAYWAKIITYTPSLLSLFPTAPMPITAGYGSAAIPSNFTWPNTTIPTPQPTPYPDVVGFALGNNGGLLGVGFVSVLFDSTPTISTCSLTSTVHQCTPPSVTNPLSWYCAPMAYGGTFTNGAGIGVTTTGRTSTWIGYALQDSVTGAWPIGQVTCIHL